MGYVQDENGRRMGYVQDENPWMGLVQTPHLPHWSGEGGYVKVREGIVRQWRRIFQDQALKDVEVLLQDDERVMADSLVLRIASPVFDAMLTHEMEERRTMTLRLGDCSGPEFRFFLRLLYTGQMDPADWPPEEQAEAPGDLYQQRQSAFRYLSFSAGVQQQCKGRGKGGPPPAPLFGVRPPQQAGMPPTVVMHNGAAPAPGGPPSPPLGLLLAATGLAKKYQVEWLLCVLVDVVKRRITEASFESILSAAIRMDLAPVRLGALDFARSHPSIRERYDGGGFPPGIAFELQAVFPMRSVEGSDGVADMSI